MAGEMGGVGFGLGQMLQQGGMGGAMAQPTMGGMEQGGIAGMLSSLGGMFGGQPGAGLDMSKLAPLMQLMQMQQQQGGQMPMTAMGMGVGPMAGGIAGGQTQAQRGYLAQGGGIAPRSVIHPR